MFLLQQPSPRRIARFLDDCRHARLSEIITPGVFLTQKHARRNYSVGERVAVIGRGPADFARACAALRAWAQFDCGWVQAFPADASLSPGAVVAVQIRHLGFWSLNGARVLDIVDETTTDQPAFGFTYGTLTNHAESGEELFEVRLDPKCGEVTYRISGVSRPASLITWLGQPIVARLQERFRVDSAAAMQRAVRARVGFG
jgi:uncharacterized protein (UPF0548 family)